MKRCGESSWTRAGVHTITDLAFLDVGLISEIETGWFQGRIDLRRGRAFGVIRRGLK